MSNKIMMYICIAILVVGVLYSELFLKSKKKTNNLQAKIHKPKELKKFKPLKGDDRYIHISQNIQLAIDKKATKNNLCLCLASSGSGKTYSFINNNLLINMDCCKVVTDVGRTMIDSDYDGFTFKQYYEDNGYEVKELDLYNFKANDCFNPLAYATRSDGRLIANEILNYDEEIDEDFLISIVRTIAQASKDNENEFWINTVRDNALTIILYMFYQKDYRNERNLVTVCKLFNKLLEYDDTTEAYGIDDVIEDFELDLSYKIKDDNGMDHVIVNETLAAYTVLERLRGMKNDLTSGGDYAASLKGSFKNSFSDKILKSNVIRTISSDTMHINDIKDNAKKTIWFVTISDIDQNYNFIASMFYVTVFNMINMAAKRSNKGKLERSVIFYLDEFGSSIFIDNFSTISATIRKKTGSGGGTIMFLVVQDLKQLKQKYGDEGMEIIVSNCAIKLYMGVDGNDTKEQVSKWGGEVVTDLAGESRSAKNVSHSTSEQFHQLLTTNYLNNLESQGHVGLLFMNGKVYQDRMIPFNRMKEYKHYMKND